MFQYDVFLSYSSKDKEAVHALAERLKEDGLRVWLDAWAILPGDSIPSKIEQGLEKSRTLLMCMSPAYFESEWGALEHYALIFRDPTNQQRRLIPLLLEDCNRPAMIAHLAHIDWRRPSEETYEKLLAACGEESPKGAICGVSEMIVDRVPVVQKGHIGTREEELTQLISPLYAKLNKNDEIIDFMTTYKISRLYNYEESKAEELERLEEDIKEIMLQYGPLASDKLYNCINRFFALRPEWEQKNSYEAKRVLWDIKKIVKERQAMLRKELKSQNDAAR